MIKILQNLVIFSIFCLYSCQSEENKNIFNETKIRKNNNTIILSPPMKKGEINIENIIENNKIVPLETNSESMIGYIDNIQFDDELIFIADRRMAKTLFIFSITGDYLTKISALGNGDKEYLTFDGFDIDKENNIIYVLDGSRGNILLWNYEGKYLDKINLPLKNIDSFIYAGNNSFYFNFGFRQNDFIKSSPHDLVLYNTDSKKMVSSFFPFDFESFKLRILDNFMFSKTEEKIYYKTLLGNEIYQLGRDSLDLVLICNLGEFQVPFDCYLLTNKEFKKLQQEKQFAKLGKFFDFNNWIYLRIDRNQMSAHYFYNKKKESGYLDLSHTILNSKFISPDIYKYDENSFCGWIMPEQLTFFNEDSQYKYIPEDNNPILIFYQLK